MWDRLSLVLANVLGGVAIVLPVLDPGRDLGPVVLLLAVAVALVVGPPLWRWRKEWGGIQR